MDSSGDSGSSGSKDLTGLNDSTESQGGASTTQFPVNEPSVETHSEVVTEFESLEDLSQSSSDLSADTSGSYDPSAAPSEESLVEPSMPHSVPVPESVAEVESEAFSPSPAQAAPLPPPIDAMENIKQYDEELGEQRSVASLPAAFPFSLLIEGRLEPADQEKLLDILSREKMGIREVDLESQLEEGRILIPRISEYAGVLLVQAMRDCPVRMKLGPSDSVFSTEATHSPRLHTEVHPDQKSSTYTQSSSHHPAESLPVLTQDRLPDHVEFKVLDTIMASASLKTQALDAEQSTEYQELIDALQREVKYKAFRKGASAVLNFSVEMLPLSLPSHYRLLVTGTAVTGISEISEAPANYQEFDAPEKSPEES